MCGDVNKKEYSDIYIIKIKTGKYCGKKFYLSVKKDYSKKIKYGDLINVYGEYKIPSEARNYKGFNYREFLKTKKIYGTIKSNNVEILEHNKINYTYIMSNKIRNGIIENINKILPTKTAGLLIGILLGDKSNISENVLNDFRESSLSHILAVSGLHTTFIILGLTYILTKSNISKRITYIITIFSLIVFMFITNFTSSVMRACLMAIIIIIANLLYRKPDIATTISITLLIALIINPYSICEIGFQLTYLGTIGIILFNKNIETILNKIKVNAIIAKHLAVVISAQAMIMPIMAYQFNTVSLSFFISNILAVPILGITIILALISILISFVSIYISKILAIILNFNLNLLIFISNISAKLPLSSIIVKTPYLFTVILIYAFILILNYVYTIYSSNENLRFFKRKILRNINKKSIKKFIVICIIVIIVYNSFSYFYILIPKDLKIYFIDVGQGDSCLIVTPHNKVVLIDGGDGEMGVLLPYLLDRRINRIDYMMISHFDSDHCNGLIEAIQKIKVKNILISKQAYFSEEYKNIANIINSKKINVIFVKGGDKLYIDKNVKMDILYPLNILDYDDLNNNSIVAKLTYNSFSILFTGDIEKSENNLLSLYNNKLKSDILKISHHGSKTSSNAEFIKVVKPQIALIGVGKNNKFGHPSNEVLQRLRKINCKIYRTDKMGEIEIRVSKNRKIFVKEKIH